MPTPTMPLSARQEGSALRDTTRFGTWFALGLNGQGSTQRKSARACFYPSDLKKLGWLADVLLTSTCHAWMGLRLHLTLPSQAFSGRSLCPKQHKYLSARRLLMPKWSATTRTRPNFVPTKEFDSFRWSRNPRVHGTPPPAAHFGSSLRQLRPVKVRWAPRCTPSCSKSAASCCGASGLVRPCAAVRNSWPPLSTLCGHRPCCWNPSQTSRESRASCFIVFPLYHPLAQFSFILAVSMVFHFLHARVHLAIAVCDHLSCTIQLFDVDGQPLSFSMLLPGSGSSCHPGSLPAHSVWVTPVGLDPEDP